MDEVERPEAQPNQAQGVEYAGHLSRRSFLKSVGATVVGSVAANLPISPQLAAAAAPTTAAVDEPWAIAAASPLLRQVIAELEAHRLTFDVDRARFRHTSDLPGLWACSCRTEAHPAAGMASIWC